MKIFMNLLYHHQADQMDIMEEDMTEEDLEEVEVEVEGEEV